MPCVTAAAVPRRARDELLDQWRVAIRALLRGFQRFDLATGSECRGARCRTRGPLQIPRQDVAQTDGDELLTTTPALRVKTLAQEIAYAPSPRQLRHPLTCRARDRVHGIRRLQGARGRLQRLLQWVCRNLGRRERRGYRWDQGILRTLPDVSSNDPVGLRARVRAVILKARLSCLNKRSPCTDASTANPSLRAAIVRQLLPVLDSLGPRRRRSSMVGPRASGSARTRGPWRSGRWWWSAGGNDGRSFHRARP